MDLTEEYAKLEKSEYISNIDIYKLQEFYSDILYVPPEKIYRSFPIKITHLEKKKELVDIIRLTIKWHPYFIIKVEYH